MTSSSRRREAASLVFGVPFFVWSERVRATHPKKYYPVDTGLRRVVVTRTGADVGKHLECATFLDFVVQRHDGVVIPVQVSLGGAQPRHHRALERFYEQFPQAGEAVVVDEENVVQLARGELTV